MAAFCSATLAQKPKAPAVWLQHTPHFQLNLRSRKVICLKDWTVSFSAYRPMLAMAAQQANQPLTVQQQQPQVYSLPSRKQGSPQLLAPLQHTTTPVVSIPPMAAPIFTASIDVPRPTENHSRINSVVYLLTVCASSCFMLCLLPLICSMPALILYSKALRNRGLKQKKLVRISAGLNVAAIVCGILIVIIVVSVSIPVSNFIK